MTDKQYRLNKWGTKLLKNNRPLFDWTNEADDIVDLLNELYEENEQLKKDVDCWKQVASKNSDEINVLECENCIHRKGIVCDLDGGHIDFTSWCDYFEYKGDDMND